jgi:predicted RNA binding protein YcfA (HicA-like mRNA interferase family)
MTRLPTLTPKKIITALKRAGFEEDVQRGSHLTLLHPIKNLRTGVPVHPGKDIGRSLLRKILNQAELSEDEFRDLL